MRRPSTLVIGAVVAAGLAGLSPGQAAAVVGGGAAADPGPVALVTISRDATSSYRCSGVLVAPRLVVTARHCVHGRSPSAWRIRLAAGTPHADEHRVTAVLVPDDPDVDLAAVRLDTRADAAPVPLAAGWRDGGPAVQYGYGSTRRGAMGPASRTAKAAGVDLAMTDELAGVGHPMLRAEPSETGSVPAGSCEFGDSGGPVRAGADGRGALVGITSRGDGGSGRCWSEPVGAGSPGGEWLARVVRTR